MKSADPMQVPAPTASTGVPASGSATDLDKYWTAERMAEAVPVEEQQAREAQLPTAPGTPAPRSPSKPFPGIKEVGTFYWAEDGEKRFCAGTVVTSPGKNLVATAAHCFDFADQMQALVFVPKHSKEDPKPYGVFPIQKGQIYADPRYMKKGGDKAYTGLDFAILKTDPRADGKALQDVVGSINLGINLGYDHPQTRVIGYPGFEGQQTPLDCTTPLKKFTTGNEDDIKGGTFPEVNCDGYVSGTSGGPFITGSPNAMKLIGVTGGWKTGGHSPNTSYSSYFGDEIKRIYDAAVAGRVPVPVVLPGPETWKHAKDVESGYFTLNGPVEQDSMDMLVRWSDGEISLYRGAGKELNYFDKEITIQKPSKLWADHAKNAVAGDFTGDNGSDLIVVWNDGEVTLYPSIDEAGFHGEKQLMPPNATWAKYSATLTAGRFGGNEWQDDLVVRWSDGELSMYQNTGDKLGKEFTVLKKNETWPHAVDVGAGDYSGGDGWDLVVRWSDGEVTNYGDFTATSLGTEHKWQAPNPTWPHAVILTGGDHSDNPYADDTLVRWTDGELSLYVDGDEKGIGKENQLVAPL
ncbi:trypsin-like serine peptidase [Streptomyces chrestomyceticus]|uniref:trypsin-like serine peptidase n=1 Tax=Streptomyces chrestomyceticus TaxID=68185 RepID=UPI0019CFC7A0|nr:trypsin-like serine protease [Streptomyces chrestomyceticus]